MAGRPARPLLRCGKISGFVLAGGRSSRLGQDKVLLPWHGGTLLEHALRQLEPVCETVRVCGDRPDLQRLLLPGLAGMANLLIADAAADAGPLAGIVAALAQSSTPWNFFLAVDLPLVPPALMDGLATRSAAARNPGIYSILPAHEGFLQPLCGLYHSSLAPGLRRALQAGKHKITDALSATLQELRDTWGAPSFAAGSDLQPPHAEAPPTSFNPEFPGLELFDVAQFAAGRPAAAPLDPGDWFLNINTPEQWRRAQVLSAARSSQQ